MRGEGPRDLSQDPDSEHDVPVRVTLLRPAGLLAGFHAEVAEDGGAGLVHAGEQWAPTSLFIGVHRHSVWELYLQAAGTSRWRVGEDVRVLEPGAVLAVPPGVAHAMAGRPSARHHFSYAAVDVAAVLARRPGLAPVWAGQDGRDGSAGSPARDRPGAWTGREAWHAPAGSALEGPFRRLVREVTARPAHGRDGLELAVDGLVLEATRLRQGGGGGTALVHPAVQAARDLLDGAYDRPWRLPDLAARAGLSPNHLAELFTRDTGLTPHRYLALRRLERAAELLRQTDLPVTAIAADLGFASPSHLARAFRARYGRSPRAWRTGAH